MSKTSEKMRVIAIAAVVAAVVSFSAARIVLHSSLGASFERGRGFRSEGMSHHFGMGFGKCHERSMTETEREAFLNARRGYHRSFCQGFKFLSENSPSALILVIIGHLSIITLGVLGLFWINALAKRVNAICEGDGKKTAGALKFLLLGIITFGIYNLLWLYMLGDRLQHNAPRYNLTFKESGSMIVLWFVPGVFILAGPFISLYIIIKNINALETGNRIETQQPL